MASSKIRVMIVDDSIFFREFMSRSLSSDPSIEVVGVASDAMEALQNIRLLRPDVITLDIEMPKMRGTDFLRQVTPQYPNIKVVVISSISRNVFEALHAGAVDFVSKPNSQQQRDNTSFLAEIKQKIQIAASKLTKIAEVEPAVRRAAPPLVLPHQVTFRDPRMVIAIGASTGGTEAILAVIKDLPVNSPGIVIVQHMPPVFTKMYAERLDKMCRIHVREAVNGDRVDPGTALIAPGGDRHMRLMRDANGYYVRLSEGEKVSGHCPSVDVLFESVAKVAGKHAVGIILTGMGSDGAKQLKAMKDAGAYTIGQDRSTCVVYGMPMVAYNLGGVIEQLPLPSIAGKLIQKLSAS